MRSFWKFLIFFSDKMAANKDSDNAESIFIAEWQEIFGNIDIVTKSFMSIPRSDELLPLPEPEKSSEDESSESHVESYED